MKFSLLRILDYRSIEFVPFSLKCRTIVTTATSTIINPTTYQYYYYSTTKITRIHLKIRFSFYKHSINLYEIKRKQPYF